MDTDLCFVKFSELSPKILITLLDNNMVYIFRISDLINIINKALTYAPHFFAEPYEIKNPYTNLPFTINNLYNIYFRLLNSSFIMPMLYHLLFLSNFDLTRFKNENECFIREKTIENFMSYASIDDKHYQINNMFYTHYKSVTFMIHSHFPREKLVSVFNKYLKSFLSEEYSLNPFIRETNKSYLAHSLSLFSKLNPAFGQRVYIKKRRSSGVSTTQFTYNDTVNEDNSLAQNTFNANALSSDIIIPRIFQQLLGVISQNENGSNSERSYLLNSSVGNVIINTASTGQQSSLLQNLNYYNVGAEEEEAEEEEAVEDEEEEEYEDNVAHEDNDVD